MNGLIFVPFFMVGMFAAGWWWHYLYGGCVRRKDAGIRFADGFDFQTLRTDWN